jgi:pimeloyl-ACP methyl ester carboxylesterase
MKKFIQYISIGILAILVVVFVAIIALAERDKKIEALMPIYANKESKFMPVLGMQVHYRMEGLDTDTVPLVFIHGTSASLHTWDSLTLLLKNKKKIIRFDLPAFGLTGPNKENTYNADVYNIFVDSVLEALHVKSCIIAGNSLGGSIAWHYALYNKSRVQQLILLDASGYPKKNEKGSLGFKIASMPIINNLLLWVTPKFLVKKSLEGVFVDKQKINEESINRYHNLLLREGNRKAALSIFKAGFTPNPAPIKTIDIPTLIIWGDQDQLINVSNAYLFNKDIKGSQLVVLKNVGHTPMEETPTKVATAISAFLKLN